MSRMNFSFFIFIFIFGTSLKAKEASEKSPSVPLISKKEVKTSTPIVLIASELKGAQYSKTSHMRLFSVDKDGNVKAIPFQIDEKDEYGDYDLENTEPPIFSDLDELAFMSEDAGVDRDPKHWDFEKPDRVYKIALDHQNQKKAVFLGVYSKKSPPEDSLSTKKPYVTLDLKNSHVATDHYLYYFNPRNYLMVKDFYTRKGGKEKTKLLTSSSFYLRLNFKYFFAISVNHNDVNSELEAYKTGPVRTIARVDFSIKVGAAKMDLGMYTEVVFFQNAIFLPALLENPINSESILKPGSDFYYGFALVENPSQVEIKSNMASQKEKKPTQHQSLYWMSTKGRDSQVYLEFKPSESMLKKQIFPKYYSEAKTGKQVLKRTEKARPLGKSRVNIAVATDMGKLPMGEHEIELAIYIGNELTNEESKAFKEHRSYGKSISEFKFK